MKFRGNSDTAKKINSRPKVKEKPDQVSHMSSPGGPVLMLGKCERRPFPGVCWCLKKEWVHMDVFRTGWRQKGQPATKTSAPIYLSWKVLFFHSSSFITIPSPVWDGHGGMVLNTKYEEGKWRGKLAKPGSPGSTAVKPVRVCVVILDWKHKILWILKL